VPLVSSAAEALADDPAAAIDVGAINCAKHATLCAKSDIRAYPTYRLAAGGLGGLSQELPFASASTAESIAKWATGVATEWRWLLHAAGDVSSISGEAAWETFLANTTAFSLVLCVDEAESGPARTARTNLLRLAASVSPARATVRVIDCGIEESVGSPLCARLGLPRPPFAPVLRALRAGAKSPKDVGEALFSPADVDAHIALAIVEAVVRLAVNVTDEVEEGKRAAFDKEAKEEEEEREEEDGGDWSESQYTPPERPKLQWSGPTRPKGPTGGGWGGGGSAPPQVRLQ